MSDLDSIVAQAREQFAAINDGAQLEEAKARFLGKSGQVTELLKGLSKLPVEERKALGEAINGVKNAIESALVARREALADAKLQQKLAAEALDVTLPGRNGQRGGLHPVMRTQRRVEEIFRSIGFDIAEGRRSKPTGTTSPH